MRASLLLPYSVFACLLGPICLLHAGTVTTINDDATPGSGSLRAVLAAATNGETIDFAPSLDGASITLTLGELVISGLTVTIDAGSLPSGISIHGNDSSRILNISSASNVTLKGLTLRNGRQDTIDSGNGGAVEAVGGVLTLSGCVIKDCYARNTGGGLSLKSGVQVNVDRCSIVGNRANDQGGGVIILGTTTVAITNTVIAGNRSLQGGGLYCLAAIPNLTNCTIQGNAGEGLRTQSFTSGYGPTIRNSIIWGNRVGSDPIADQQIKSDANTAANVDYSVVEGRPASANNLNGTDVANTPLFVSAAVPANAPLSTADVRLLINSTSINAGSNAAALQLLDRAGLPRIQEITVDMGAFENGYVTFAALHPLLLPDGDENQNGLSNYQEYALGVDPAGGAALAAMPSLSQNGGVRLLTSSQRINGLDVIPDWSTSTDLEPLSWQPMIPGVDCIIHSSAIVGPGRQEQVFELIDTDPTRFYRQGFSTN